MSIPLIKSFADKTGKTEKEVESLWNRAREIVKKGYLTIPVESDRYFRLITGVLNNMLKLETITTTGANVGDSQSGAFSPKLSGTGGKAITRFSEYYYGG